MALSCSALFLIPNNILSLFKSTLDCAARNPASSFTFCSSKDALSRMASVLKLFSRLARAISILRCSSNKSFLASLAFLAIFSLDPAAILAISNLLAAPILASSFLAAATFFAAKEVSACVNAARFI